MKKILNFFLQNSSKIKERSIKSFKSNKDLLRIRHIKENGITTIEVLPVKADRTVLHL